MKKLLSFLLEVVMLLSLAPMALGSEEPEEEPAGVVVEESIEEPDLEGGWWREYGDFSYNFLGPGRVEITDYWGSGGSVSIPAEIDGYPVESIGVAAFCDYDTITEVIIPDSVEYIEDEAFFGCDGLTSVIIGNGVVGIGEEAFGYCDVLKSITIGSSVAAIGERAFDACPDLTEINVSPENDYYASLDGVLFNFNLSMLLRVPEGRSGSYTIPNSVTNIGRKAFYECTLDGLYIPSSVTAIGGWAFCGCVSYGVYYGGSEEDWAKIKIGDVNDDLTSAMIHFNSVIGDPNTYELDLSGAQVSGSEVTGTGKMVQTGGNQPVGKRYAYIVVSYERKDGSTWAVAGTYAVDSDGEFDLPSITGVSDKLVSVLVIGLDAKVGASWSGHNITKPGRIKP